MDTTRRSSRGACTTASGPSSQRSGRSEPRARRPRRSWSTSPKTTGSDPERTPRAVPTPSRRGWRSTRRTRTITPIRSGGPSTADRAAADESLLIRESPAYALTSGFTPGDPEGPSSGGAGDADGLIRQRGDRTRRAGRSPQGGEMGQILIIEDDPRIREIVERGLEARGFAVISASDGPKGL